MDNNEEMRKLEIILNSIKSKTNTIASQTRFLQTFNKKLEILLMCFEAYSIEDKEFTSDQNELRNNENTKKILNKEELQIIEAIKLENVKNDGIENIKRSKIENSLDSAIDKLFNKDPLTKSIARNILDLIKLKEPISLDELVKGIKNSKYKVIAVLNILIKERMIVKKYEKEFVYRLSKDIQF